MSHPEPHADKAGSSAPSGGAAGSARRVLVVVADSLDGPEPASELLRGASEPDALDIRLLAPAVEDTQFHHLLGDEEESARVARARLEASLDSLRRNGVPANGVIGASDPVVAIEDELRRRPDFDEIVIFEHDGEHARWFERGLLDRAREEISVPMRVVFVTGGEDGETRVLEARQLAPAPPEDGLEISDNLPRFAPGDLGGMVMGVVGTIVAIVLAAAGPGPESSWGAVSILIAMGVALINMAHVVGLTLLESVHYRGGFASFFSRLSLVGTPSAVLANLLILLLA